MRVKGLLYSWQVKGRLYSWGAMIPDGFSVSGSGDGNGIALLKRRIDDPEGLVQEGVPGVDEGFLSPGGDS